MKNYNTTSQEIVGGLLSQWLTSYLTLNGFIKDQENIVSGSYVETNLANLYTQALMAIETTYSNPAIARQILDNINSIYNTTFNIGPGGMYNAYNTDTGVPDTTSDRYLSNNAWILLACSHYAAVNLGTPDQFRYKIMADGIAVWIVSQQDVLGSPRSNYNDLGFYSGYKGNTSPTPDAPITGKIQEANVTSIAALRAHATYYQGKYKINADNAEKFLFLAGGSGIGGGLYMTSTSRFYAGKWDGNPSIYDSIDYLDNLLWASLMVITPTLFAKVSAGEAGVVKDLSNGSGFSDSTIKIRIFIEAFAYFALLHTKQYISSGEINESHITLRSHYLDSYVEYLISSISFQGSSVPVVNSLPDYDGELTSLAAEPALWYLLALNDINPLDPGQLKSNQFSDVVNVFQYTSNNIQA